MIKVPCGRVIFLLFFFSGHSVKIVITCYAMMMMMTLDAGVLFSYCVCVGKNHHLVPVGGALSDHFNCGARLHIDATMAMQQ